MALSFQLTRTAQQKIHEWLKLPHETMAEIHVSDDHIIDIGRVLSQPPDSDTCSPKQVETVRLMMHVHSKKCYERLYIEHGYPSGQDIYTILTHDLPLHVVGAVEGWYLIRMRKHAYEQWKMLSKEEKKEWKQAFDVPGDVGSITDYLNYINQFPWVRVVLNPWKTKY